MDNSRTEASGTTNTLSEILEALFDYYKCRQYQQEQVALQERKEAILSQEKTGFR